MFIGNRIICVSLEKMCEAPTTLKIEKGQMENVLSSKFLGFSDHCSHFMTRNVYTLCIMPISMPDIFISMKPENFCRVLLPVAHVLQHQQVS